MPGRELADRFARVRVPPHQQVLPRSYLFRYSPIILCAVGWGGVTVRPPDIGLAPPACVAIGSDGLDVQIGGIGLVKQACDGRLQPGTVDWP